MAKFWCTVAYICLVIVVGSSDVYDFGSGATIDECSELLKYLITPKGEITCEEVNQWAQCAARALGLATRSPTPQDNRVFQTALQNNLELFVLQCEVDLYDVIASLPGGLDRGYTSAQTKESPTTSGVPYPTTPQLPYTSTSNYPKTDIPDATQYATATPASAAIKGCLAPGESTCFNRPNGNYAICPPTCERGVYIACTNHIVQVMNCGLGYFNNVTIKSVPPVQFTAPMVFDTLSGYCFQSSPDCPRPWLDDKVPLGK